MWFMLRYSPRGAVLSVPIAWVTVLLVSYDPPLRGVRRAPPSLRPASIAPDQVRQLAALVQSMAKR